MAHGDGVDQALVAGDELGPGLGIASQACLYELRVRAIVNHGT